MGYSPWSRTWSCKESAGLSDFTFTFTEVSIRPKLHSYQVQSREANMGDAAFFSSGPLPVSGIKLLSFL